MKYTLLKFNNETLSIHSAEESLFFDNADEATEYANKLYIEDPIANDNIQYAVVPAYVVPRPTSDRMWRTLVNIVDIDFIDGEWATATLRIPAWSSTNITVDPDVIPKHIQDKYFKTDDHVLRVHAMVNTGTTFPSDLRFEQWEDS